MSALAWLLALATIPAAAQNWDASMGSVDEYLMNEGDEIALARSAAPAHVSSGARVLVFRRDGHHEAAPGTNGFTCLVERSWSSPIGPHRDFFNPKLRAPICYNEEAARTILGDYLRRTELALGGASVGDIRDAIEREIGSGKLRAPEGLAMSYMLSAGQLLGTEVGRFKPHVMFYVPYATTQQLGSPPPGCEHVCVFEHGGGPLAALIVPVENFNEVPEPGAPEPRTAAQEGAPEQPTVASMAFLYTQMKGFVLETAERMPEDKYGFRITPENRTFAENLAHVADGNYNFCSSALGRKNPYPDTIQGVPGELEKSKSTKKDVIQALQASFELCDEAFRSATDASLEDVVSFTSIAGTNETRRAFPLTLTIFHGGWMYGTLATYLRMNRITPPYTRELRDVERTR